MYVKTKPEKAVHKNRLRNILIMILILVALCCVWKGIRRAGNISCQLMPSLPISTYSEKDKVINAIALSYLVYGCETCNELSGTVSELIDSNEMGILNENFGLKRADSDDPASALIDTSDFIKQFVGDYRFLSDLKDDKSGFYGAAFCDDNAKCVWIAFAGSVSFRDAVSCIEFVLAPGLSLQEKQAFKLYDSVIGFDEVQKQAYHIVLTGHSMGGSLATMIACASGCSAVTVNGADGIAIDKFYAINEQNDQGNYVSNYMTSPKNGRFSLMDMVQSLMFLGDYKAVDYHVYSENGYTTDTHCAFSFIEFEDDERRVPAIP